MTIKAYFLFPTTDADFIRIGDDPQAYRDLIDEVAIIKQHLKSKKKFELYYDSLNVNLFLTKAESLIKEEYLADCRTQLKILFSSFSQNVSISSIRIIDCIYACWNINYIVSEAERILAEVAEAKLNEGVDKTILINISNAYINNRDYVHIIKDAIHYNDLPQLARIPVANNEIEFSEWYSIFENPAFSTKDKARFQITNFRWKKQSIYLEKDSGNFWYYDYFHKENKEHYEVFDAAGVHLGEANINGDLNTGKKSGKKSINDILHGKK